MTKIYVLDAKILLHDPQSIFKFDDNEVVIPYATLEELESKKRRSDDIGRAAHEAIRYLDELRPGIKGKSLSAGVDLPNGGRLRVELNHYSGEVLPLYSDITLEDNRILAVSLNLTRESENRPVILVTKDLAMRVKADALGIVCQDFKNDKVKKDLVNDNVIEINLTETEVSLIYQQGFIKLSEPLLPNQCVRALVGDTVLPVVSSPDGWRLIYMYEEPTWNIYPRNIYQVWAVQMLNNPEITIVNLMGSAGSGKTLLTLASGLEQTLNDETYRRILCARPALPMEDLGALPGDEEQKIDPYMAPIYDNLELLLRQRSGKVRSKNRNGIDDEDDPYINSTIDMLKKKKQLKVQVLAFIRGRSIPNQFFIIDEAQNTTPSQIKTYITRAGEGTKVILCGDPDQIDNPYLDKQSNGQAHVASCLKGQPFYGQVYLPQGERSELASKAAQLL